MTALLVFLALALVAALLPGWRARRAEQRIVDDWRRDVRELQDADLARWPAMRERAARAMGSRA